MEAHNRPTISMMSQNDQLRMCSCGHDKAICYCLEACDVQMSNHPPVYYCFDRNTCKCSIIKKLDIFCCISDVNYQREYCIDCGEKTHFDHGVLRILVLVDEIAKYHWALLFEKISHLQEVACQKYEPYHDLVLLLEDMYKKKVIQEPQNSPLFSDMYTMLKSLYEECIMKYKEKVEDFINKQNLTELFKMKDIYHTINTTFETIKPLELFDPQNLYERYLEVFQYPFDRDRLSVLKFSNFLLMKDFKKKFVESLINQQNNIVPHENRQNVISLLFLEYFMIEEIQNTKSAEEFKNQLNEEIAKVAKQVKETDEENKKDTIALIDGVKKDTDERYGHVIKQLEEDKQEIINQNKNEIMTFKNDVSQEINQINGSNNQKFEILNSQIIELKQQLKNEIDELVVGDNTLEFEGKQWKILFGVNSSDKFPYNNDFWTKKEEMNPQPDKRIQRFKNSFKLKAFWKYKLEKILIISESGLHTILSTPSNTKSLMDCFNDENTVTNLTYVSGAKDPVELINKKQGIKFYEQVWRINSKRTDGTKFMTRLGGYYYDRQGKCESYKDNKQQVIYREMAGFGILDEFSVNRVYGNKSFGIRTAYDYTDGQGQVQIGAIVCGL